VIGEEDLLPERVTHITAREPKPASAPAVSLKNAVADWSGS
jgi:hypothetical protein